MAATANVVMNVDEWDPRWYQFQSWRIKLRRLTLFLDFGLGMFHQGLNFNRQLGRNTRLAYPVVRYRGIGWMRSRHTVRQSVALWHCSDTEIIQEISALLKTSCRAEVAKVLNQRITACSTSSFAACVCMCSVVLCCYFVMLPFHRWWRMPHVVISATEAER